MNVTLRKPRMTREEFFAWAEVQNERYEFDGFAPVAMVGGTINHSRISQNIYAALRYRLRGSPCELLGPDAGVATVGDAVRYPDALISCAKLNGNDRVVPGVVVIFEVLSPTSSYRDRIEKLIEYRAIASIRRYVIAEYNEVGLSVFERSAPDRDWIATALTKADILHMPEIGIEIPVVEFYEGTDLLGTREAPVP